MLQWYKYLDRRDGTLRPIFGTAFGICCTGTVAEPRELRSVWSIRGLKGPFCHGCYGLGVGMRR